MKEDNAKVIKEDTSDRISELPECIIENILSRLDHPKARVRVSVLSKIWFALTASLPVLEFSSRDFWKDDRNKFWRSDDRENFYKYVEHTVSRFCCQQNVMNAQTFKLCTTSGTDAELKIIGACLELILLKGVKVLEIMINEYWYHLPDILTSASSLTSLKVFYCMLPSSMMVDVANFKSLKVLWLYNLSLDPLVIKNLNASCPILEELNVEGCSGFKTLHGQFQNLKKIRFLGDDQDGVNKIQIEAPKLCECHLSQIRHVEGKGGTYVNLGSCKQLRTLLLHGSFFPPSIRLSDFLSNFPVLENLSLSLVERCSSLEVSSPSLRKFVLYYEGDLEEIDINTPNLLFFCHSNAWNYLNPCEYKKIDSGELNARMEFHIIKDVDTVFFPKLRRFLERANRFKILLLNNYFLAKLPVDFDQLKLTRLPPYELEHVELQQRTENVLTVLDGLLWCCRPRTLSLTSNFSLMSHEERCCFLKIISEKLLQQEDQGTDNIRIEWSFPSKSRIYFSWSSMLIVPGYKILQTATFRKEEVAREKKIMKPSKVCKC